MLSVIVCRLGTISNSKSLSKIYRISFKQHFARDFSPVLSFSFYISLELRHLLSACGIIDDTENYSRNKNGQVYFVKNVFDTADLNIGSVFNIGEALEIRVTFTVKPCLYLVLIILSHFIECNADATVIALLYDFRIAGMVSIDFVLLLAFKYIYMLVLNVRLNRSTTAAFWPISNAKWSMSFDVN